MADVSEDLLIWPITDDEADQAAMDVAYITIVKMRREKNPDAPESQVNPRGLEIP